MNKSYLLPLFDLHWFVSEVYLLEEIWNALLSLSLDRAWSDKAFTVLRLLLVLLFFGFFSDGEKVGSSFDSTLMYRLVVWLFVVACTIEMVRQCSLRSILSNASYKRWLHSKCLSELRQLSGSHKSLLHLLRVFLSYSTSLSLLWLSLIILSICLRWVDLTLRWLLLALLLGSLNHLVNLCVQRSHGLASVHNIACKIQM